MEKSSGTNKIVQVSYSSNYKTMYFQTAMNIESWEKDGKIKEIKKVKGVKRAYLENKHEFSVFMVDDNIIDHETISDNIVKLFDKLSNEKGMQDGIFAECLRLIERTKEEAIREQEYTKLVNFKKKVSVMLGLEYNA